MEKLRSEKGSNIIRLHFSEGENPELIKTVFECSKLESKITGQRTIGLLPQGTVSFKWTQCTRALSMFFVNAKLRIPGFGESTALLEGFSLSPAASLGARLWKRDYAWVHDVFGSDKDGTPLLRLLAIGINIRRKTKAPIQLFLRTSFLSEEDITVFVGARDISRNTAALRNLALSLKLDWAPGDNGRGHISASKELQERAVA